MMCLPQSLHELTSALLSSHQTLNDGRFMGNRSRGLELTPLYLKSKTILAHPFNHNNSLSRSVCIVELGLYQLFYVALGGLFKDKEVCSDGLQKHHDAKVTHTLFTLRYLFIYYISSLIHHVSDISCSSPLVQREGPHEGRQGSLPQRFVPGWDDTQIPFTLSSPEDTGF